MRCGQLQAQEGERCKILAHLKCPYKVHPWTGNRAVAADRRAGEKLLKGPWGDTGVLGSYRSFKAKGGDGCMWLRIQASAAVLRHLKVAKMRGFLTCKFYRNFKKNLKGLEAVDSTRDKSANTMFTFLQNYSST